MFRAPGRVNLIGDHTDYHEGFVLPMAVDRWCTVRATPTVGRAVVRARSAQLPGVAEITSAGAAAPATIEPPWARFVGGALHAVASRYGALPSLDVSVASTVPVGAGLSSSSALSVALVLALTGAAGSVPDPATVVALASDAEIAATGVHGGRMDQLAAVHGRAGHALLIDCRSLEVEPIPLPADAGVLAIHCGRSRALAGTAYGARRAQSAAAARRLGLRSLRDGEIGAVASEPRARHVVAENERVRAAAVALRTGDAATVGALMLASHASLRDDYEVSTPELDCLVELASAHGAWGARLTGAGFGGCIVALVPRARIATLASAVTTGYSERTGLTATAFALEAVDGASPTGV